MVCTSWINSFEAAGNMHLVASLCAATDVFRGWGDCYGYALVATGRAEIMIDPALKVWDAAPLLICVEEAGGRYTTFAGKPDIHGGSAVASNGPFHDEILRILQA
jgi:fructose-1,6-bisphosphatase/inositol monophosphatase family enzyme